MTEKPTTPVQTDTMGLRVAFAALAAEMEQHSNEHIRDEDDTVCAQASIEGVCADRIKSILRDATANATPAHKWNDEEDIDLGDVHTILADRDRLAGLLINMEGQRDHIALELVDALKAAQQQAVESMQERAALVAENYASRVLVHMKSEEREAIKSFFNGMVSVAEEIRALKPNQTPPSTEREI